ncbi:MAG: SGNH/GDSL hydrolase family protein [Solirubrobacterales bacterium]
MRPIATIMFVFLAAILAGCGTDPAPSNASRYVALGDSNASGAGLPTPETGAPENCFRTDSGYPAFAAEQLNLEEFESVACSGAGMNAFSDEIALYPDGRAPPQFDALKGNETVVSITIGDNDAGYGEVTENCLKAKNPEDTPCEDKYVTAGGNQLEQVAATLAAPLSERLSEVREHSPQARIFVVGYAPMVPAGGAGCWGKVNVSNSDAQLVFGWQKAINQTLRTTAEANEAIFVDLFAAGVGHDACQPAGRRWTNPVKGVGAAGWPLHPNLAGSKAAAAALVESVKRSKLDAQE